MVREKLSTAGGGAAAFQIDRRRETVRAHGHPHRSGKSETARDYFQSGLGDERPRVPLRNGAYGSACGAAARSAATRARSLSLECRVRLFHQWVARADCTAAENVQA